MTSDSPRPHNLGTLNDVAEERKSDWLEDLLEPAGEPFPVRKVLKDYRTHIRSIHKALTSLGIVMKKKKAALENHEGGSQLRATTANFSDGIYRICQILANLKVFKKD